MNKYKLLLPISKKNLINHILASNYIVYTILLPVLGIKLITISLCMIVRDEEETLARCLNSIYDLVDEIIIVDTGSADETKKSQVTIHLRYMILNG